MPTDIDNKIYCRAPLGSIERFARVADRYGYTRSSLLRLLVEATIEGDISIPRVLEKRFKREDQKDA